jgi:putative transposase
MSSSRRTFSYTEKMNILKEVEESGVIKVLKEHKLSYSVYSRWKHQLAETKMTQREDSEQTKKEKEQLEIENARLKKIIAEQALEMEMRAEEWKKTNPLYGRR